MNIHSGPTYDLFGGPPIPPRNGINNYMGVAPAVGGLSFGQQPLDLARQEEERTGLTANGQRVRFLPGGMREVGGSPRSDNALGGNTFGGNAISGGQFFAGQGGTFGPMGGGAADPFDPRSKFDASKGKYTFAEGGEVDGPGGPKDDLIPAMLSDGEYIMPAEAVKFFGLDKLNKMKEKAREEMMGMKTGSGGAEEKRSGVSPPPLVPSSPLPLMMAEGGPVSNPGYDNFEALKAFYQDPRNQLARQEQAFAAANPNTIDAGGGNRVLAPNPYGTGFAVPGAPTGAGLIADEKGRMMNTGTPTAPKLAPMPDVVPSGPWSTGGQMPDLGFAERAKSNAWQADQLIQSAPERLAADAAARRANYSTLVPNTGTVPPNYNPFPNGTPKMEVNGYDSDNARLARAEADRAAGRPDGMRQTDWNQLKRDPKFLMSRSEDQAARVFSPAVDEQGRPIPGMLMNNRGQQFTTGKPAGPDSAKIAALEKVMTTDPNLANRERAKREWEGLTGVKRSTPPAPTDKTQQKGRIVMQGDQPIMLNPDGTYQRAVNAKPSDKQKKDAFKDTYDREPATAEEWSEAWYLASGKEPAAPAAPATSAAAPAVAVVTTRAAYDALPSGAQYQDSNGRIARKK